MNKCPFCNKPVPKVYAKVGNKRILYPLIFHPKCLLNALSPGGEDLKSKVANYEFMLINNALNTTSSKQAAADTLGIKRTTLVEKLKKREEGQ